MVELDKANGTSLFPISSFPGDDDSTLYRWRPIFKRCFLLRLFLAYWCEGGVIVVSAMEVEDNACDCGDKNDDESVRWNPDTFTTLEYSRMRCVIRIANIVRSWMDRRSL